MAMKSALLGGQENFLMRDDYVPTIYLPLTPIQTVRGEYMVKMTPEENSFSLECLTRNFGLSSDSIGPEMIRIFYSDIKKSMDTSKRTSLNIRFDDWKETCGDLFNSENLSLGSSEAIEESFGVRVNNSNEFLYFLFSMHTYAALVYRSIIIKFLNSRLDLDCKTEKCEGMESFDALLMPPDLVVKKIGGLFDETHFTWISCPESFKLNHDSILPLLDEFKNRRNSFHFPSKLPENDVLREFFHELIPQKLRKSLGEFHTPNWLVGITVDASGFTGNKGEKALDPTCGSGTFLRELIRLKQDKLGLNRDTLDDIIATIKGYELNPLSQIISISNYLMSLDKLIPFIFSDDFGKLILPVYQCDSVCLPMQQNMMEHRGHVNITIANQEVEISKNTILNPSMDNISKEQDIRDLILNFKARDQDFIIQSCKSKIAPLDRFQADFLVGNPPWLNWNNMSEKLKQKTGEIWRGYGLFEFSTGYDQSTASDDLAMAVTYVSADKYLTKNGKMAFILPRSFLQSSKGGRGFRKWKLESPPKLPQADPSKFSNAELRKHLKAKGCYPIGTKKDELVEQYNRELKSQINSQKHESKLDADLRVLKVIDLSGSARFPKIPSINPWPGGSVPCMILCLEKGKKTNYPVKLIKLVQTQKDETRNGSMGFDELHWSGTPYDTEDSLSQWYIAPKEEVTEFVDFCKALKMNESPYKAVKGWEPAGAKGIHLLNRDLISRINKNTLCITNDPRRSKKPKPNKETGNVEQELVYPTISGSDITAWRLKSVRNFALIPHLESEIDNMSIIPFGKMKKEFPLALSWLSRFEQNAERTLSERKLKGHKSLRRNKNLLSTMEVPWYAVDNIHPKLKGNHTWKPYKLVYNEQGEFGATVISTFKCSIFPDGKIILPDSKTFLIGFDDEDAAHFCAGMFNAPFVRRIVQRFTGELTRGSEVFKLLCPPIFDSSNKLHCEISHISKTIKSMAENGDDFEAEEKKLDSLVKRIYSL